MSDNTNRRTILLIDGDPSDRAELRDILASDFLVLEADGVRAGLDLLRRCGNIQLVICAVSLREKLDEIFSDERFRGIPVVVINDGEDESDSGVVEVIARPYRSSVITRRIYNLLELFYCGADDGLSERDSLRAKLIHNSEYDALTGLWNKKTFSQRAARIIADAPERDYVLARFDLDSFKVFNDIFGTGAGDRLLADIGRLFREYETSACAKGMLAYCRWDSDHFVSLWDSSMLNDAELYRFTEEQVDRLFPSYSFSVRYGFCRLNDPEADIGVMCDRALLALRSVKSSYDTHYSWYVDSMRDAVVEEHNIVSVMRDALKNGEFVPYFQPQYNYETKKISGAEALARWIRPGIGIVSPAKFIPVFEKNGFILELDKYIWERVCACIRRWIDAGIRVPSVSVNVSRRDFYNSGLPSILEELTSKYRIDPSLLHLEITESACTDDPDQLLQTISKLKSRRFLIEMDDFGSGYSSLNTLKDVPVDILKMDMTFISRDSVGSKSGSIISSVVRMAREIRLPVIAEGVETGSQADFLKSIGCLHMQGYYFAKPIPETEFEKLLRSVSSGTETGWSADGPLCSGSCENRLSESENRRLISERDAFFHALHADYPVIIICNLTKNSYRILGYEHLFNHTAAEEGSFDGLIKAGVSSVPDESAAAFSDAFSRQSLLAAFSAGKKLVRLEHGQLDDCGAEHRIETTVYNLYNRFDGDTIAIAVSRETDDRKTNIEKLRQALEKTSDKLAKRLYYGDLINSVAPGLIVLRYISKRGQRPSGIDQVPYIMGNLSHSIGYTNEEIIEYMDKNISEILHPDDIPALMELTSKVSLEQPPEYELMYRVRKKDGGYA